MPFIDQIKVGSTTRDIQDTGARTNEGTLSNLTTTEKGNLVGAINEVNNESSKLNKSVVNLEEVVVGEVPIGAYERGARYTENGEEVVGNSNTRLRNKTGTYIHFKAGDKIVFRPKGKVKGVYQYLFGYSTDNGTTWASTVNTSDYTTVAADCIGFITIKYTNSSSFPDNIDYTALANSIIMVVRPGSVLEATEMQNVSIKALSAAGSGVLYTDHNIGSVSANPNYPGYSFDQTKRVCEMPATNGDALYVAVTLLMNDAAEYVSHGIEIFEAKNDNTTVKRTKYTDLSDVITYNVSGGANTTKVYVYPFVEIASGYPQSSHSEVTEIYIAIVNAIVNDDVYTEAGDTWEV